MKKQIITALMLLSGSSYAATATKVEVNPMPNSAFVFQTGYGVLIEYDYFENSFTTCTGIKGQLLQNDDGQLMITTPYDLRFEKLLLLRQNTTTIDSELKACQAMAKEIDLPVMLAGKQIIDEDESVEDDKVEKDKVPKWWEEFSETQDNDWEYTLFKTLGDRIEVAIMSPDGDWYAPDLENRACFSKTTSLTTIKNALDDVVEEWVDNENEDAFFNCVKAQ
ncbi:MAG: hypothetical protein KAI83_20215 [Thiomargarita sp.]|nr:hypothetical protein [Thiomargarita sp.]